MEKKLGLFVFCCLCLVLSCNAQNITVNATNSNVNIGSSAAAGSVYEKRSSRYDYVYEAPRRQSLDAYGRYIKASSNVRYINSPSRLKNAKHAARINAYNAQMYY